SKLIKSIKVPVLAEEKLDSEPLEPAQTLPESPYILHTGSLSDKKDGITGMLKAFALALPELAQEVKFVMTGYIEYSNDKLKILEVIDKFKIREKVIFTGFVSVKHLSHLQKHASLAIINKPFTEQNLYNFPTKLAEYMLHGIPVVATRYGEITNYLTDNVNVYFVDKGDPELMAEKITDAFTNELKRHFISENGMKLAQKEFDIVYQGARMKEFFSNLLLKP
ncbi:MAG: glycosyltransferase, partial [Mariniphaga sp.]